MSYDLMVFSPDAAPRTRYEFMNWYYKQTQWEEDHSYNDPAVTTENLRNWFKEMIETFPAMNGPYASNDFEDEDVVTEYCIGCEVIYVAFSWSVAEKAYPLMKELAEKYKVGFFDASADDGDILFPGNNDKNEPIDRPGNLSSIQQIKNSASPGQENKSVGEIIYSKVIPKIIEQHNLTKQEAIVNKRSWWKKIFGVK